MPASGRIRASSTSCVQSVRPRDGGSLEVRTWWTRPDSTEAGLGRPAHVDHLSGRGRPLRKSYPAELRRRGRDTYEFRPADRTDDYSASDFVISEALQQTDFDGIRHGVLSGWTASSSRTPTQPDTSRNRPAGAPLRPPVIDGIEEHDPPACGARPQTRPSRR